MTVGCLDIALARAAKPCLTPLCRSGVWGLCVGTLNTRASKRPTGTASGIVGSQSRQVGVSLKLSACLPTYLVYRVLHATIPPYCT